VANDNRLKKGTAATFHQNQEKKLSLLNRVLFWAVPTVAFSILIGVIWAGFSMRPIADDYGMGASAGLGIFGAVEFWWQNWSGSLSTIFLQVLLVGLPLYYLPWPVASLVPFLASSMLTSGLLTWIVATNLQGFSSKRPKGFGGTVFFSLAMVMWWGFWWVSAVTTETDSSENLWPRAIAFWQIVNVGYVAVIVIAVWIWLVLEKNFERFRNPVALFAFSAAGLIVGFMGPVVALSSAIFAGAIVAAKFFFGPAKNRTFYLATSVGMISLITAAVVDNLSPGSSRRSEALADPSIRELAVGLIQLPPKATMDFWLSISGIGTVVSFVTLGGFAVAMSWAGAGFSARKLARLGSGLLGFALVLAVVSRLGQLFSYEAWWHVMGVRTLVWLATSCLGIALGAYLQHRLRSNLLVPASLIFTVTGLALSGSSLGLMAYEVQSRLSAWNEGPASTTGIADIEIDWVNQGWLELNGGRKTPIERAPH